MVGHKMSDGRLSNRRDLLLNLSEGPPSFPSSMARETSGRDVLGANLLGSSKNVGSTFAEPSKKRILAVVWRADGGHLSRIIIHWVCALSRSGLLGAKVIITQLPTCETMQSQSKPCYRSTIATPNPTPNTITYSSSPPLTPHRSSPCRGLRRRVLVFQPIDSTFPSIFFSLTLLSACNQFP
ncbi:hypothetical protein HZH68_015729 [Vespula germanica]|uniref:Uncharacterized protein n=1 Tax=Vespula germanica TaxID=30212 RepID=A0A834JA44_VESGE|nr:hypothetical protein HZH68_015729 [Vespula germanica]